VIISILQGDALVVPADVLVLKYAQGLFGVDAQVVRRLNTSGAGVFREVPLPKPGTLTLVESRGLIGARTVMLVAVAPLLHFGYEAIRSFATGALAALADAMPDAAEVALTLHGVGYGLDETEAFRAELAGIVEAFESGRHPKALRRVVIVEHDPGRVQRLQQQLDQILPDGGTTRPLQQAATALQSDALRTAGKASRDKAHVFVAMPFAKEFDDRFHYGIHTAIRNAGYLCERADMASFSGDILLWVKERIETADLLVADLSGANPNVYLEVGYAWGKGLPTVLLASDEKDLLFDVRGQRCLVYESSIRVLEQLLTDELSKLAVSGRADR